MIAHALDYPRPQMARPGWINLNGKWDYMTDDAGSGEAEEWYRAFPSGAAEILVPFAPETAMSGIGDETHHSAMWYSRSFTVLRDPEKRLLLHFEGVDFTAKVWVNGIFIGEHRGGYARFSFDGVFRIGVGRMPAAGRPALWPFAWWLRRVRAAG